MPGYTKAPEWLKEAYRQAVKGECEECHRYEKECGKLQPHRIVRGRSGGDYRPGNVKMLCEKCHTRYHAKEF